MNVFARMGRRSEACAGDSQVNVWMDDMRLVAGEKTVNEEGSVNHSPVNGEMWIDPPSSWDSGSTNQIPFRDVGLQILSPDKTIPSTSFFDLGLSEHN